MKTKLYLFSLISYIFLGSSLIAQPYSQPPFHAVDIMSMGDYELAGKNYYISDIHYYNLISSQFDKSKESFFKYLEEALSLYGANRTNDSLNADFYINVYVDYWDSDSDVTKSPKLNQRNLNYPSYYNYYRLDGSGSFVNQDKTYGQNYYDTELARQNVALRDNFNNIPVSNNNKKTRHSFNKSIVIEGFEVNGGNRNLLWMTQATDNRGGSNFLEADEPMLYLMMRAFGKTVKPQKCFIAKEDPYFDMFKKFELGNNISYHISYTSSDENVGLFMAEKRVDTDELVLFVQDNNKISSDFTHKKYTAAIRIGDKIIECSKKHYDVRPVKYNRLLAVTFPLSNIDAEQFDLVFFKEGHPDKVKYSVSQIKLN